MQDRSIATVDAILRATGEMLAAHGSEVTIRAIARRAGVGTASLYRYFDDKEALLDAVAGLHAARLTEVIEETFARRDTPPSVSAARDLVRAILAVEDEIPGGAALLRMRARGRPIPAFDRFEARAEELWIAWFRHRGSFGDRSATMLGRSAWRVISAAMRAAVMLGPQPAGERRATLSALVALAYAVAWPDNGAPDEAAEAAKADQMA